MQLTTLTPRQFGIEYTNYVENGGVCFSDTSCKSGFYQDRRCVTNYCTSNQDCDFQTICSHGSACILSFLPDGFQCEQGEQCRSGNCADRHCAAGTGYPGAECVENRECSPGLICRNMEFIAQDRKKCLKPDGPGVKGGMGKPCRGDEDCGRGLECKDERQGVDRIKEIFNGFRARPLGDHFVCVEKEQCTPFQRQCFVDSDCCSNKCRTTEIFIVRQCEE